MTSTTLSSSAARGSAITLAFQAVRLVLSLGSLVVLGRLIDPHDFGLMAMVMALVAVAEIFRDFGLSMAALQARDLSGQQRTNLFWINTAVGGTLSVVVFALAQPIAAFYGEPRLVDVVRAIAVTYLFGGATTQFRVNINRQLRFFALSMTDLLPYALSLGTAVVVALGGYGLWALVTQQLVLAGTTLVVSAVLARWLPGLPRRAPMRHLLTFGLSLAATQGISYLTRNLDSVAIGKVYGAAVLGPYDRAYQLMVLPLSQVNTPLTKVAVPVLSRLRDDPERLTSYLRRAQLVALYVTATGFAFAVAMGPEAVRVVLGPDWAAAGHLLSILAVGGVARSLVQICYWIYMSQGLAAVQLRYFAVAQPLLVLSMMAGLPWGAEGVAYAHSIGFTVYWAVSLWWACRAAGLDPRPFFQDAVRAVFTFAAPAGLAAWLVTRPIDSPVLALGVGGAAAGLWYLVAYWLLPSVRRDLSQLVDFARQAVGRRA